MILYQLAKRLEQRKQLTQTILTSGDEQAVDQLVSQREQVEEQLFTQANRWSAEGNDEFVLAGLVPDSECDLDGE
ncbi:hypothetical protein ACHHV8_00600 [Paenibacillus sp. TAB 01]|uniref:hypothetical protein n=1 Tax=Paenibacillus sp. TAB 01 TaxID=3368988 RepID=UPI003751C821